MSKPCRTVFMLGACSVAGVLAMSCAEQLPTSPSAGPTVGREVVTEYFVTLADETPAPPPGAPQPAPVPMDPLAPGWNPGGPPRPAPGAPVPTPPSTHPRVSMKVDPDPVPHSGRPITDVSACRNPVMKYTWYYDQYLHGETGVTVTFTERENFFDGNFTSRNGESLVLKGNGTIVLRTRWCSGYGKFHYAQTRFKGRDEHGEPVVISGPWVRLLAP